MATIKAKRPEGWNEVTLGMYCDYLKMYANAKVDNEKVLATVSGFTGVPVVELSEAKIADVIGLHKKIMSSLAEKPESIFKRKIELNGVTYLFDEDLANTKFGMWVDIETITASNPEVQDHALRLMSALYRPMLENGKIAPYEGTNEETFRDLPVEVFHGANDFFLRLDWELLKNFRLSTQKRKAIWKWKKMRNQKNPTTGDGGLTTFFTWLRERSTGWSK